MKKYNGYVYKDVKAGKPIKFWRIVFGNKDILIPDDLIIRLMRLHDTLLAPFQENTVSIILNKDGKLFAHGVLLEVLNEKRWLMELRSLQKRLEELNPNPKNGKEK